MFPWQAYGKSYVDGRRSTAIVPFYGQGMNASFEDVVVLDRIIDKYEGDWEKIFESINKPGQKIRMPLQIWL